MGIFGRKSELDDKDYFTSGEEDKTVSLPDSAKGKIMKLNQKVEGGGYGFISSKDIPFVRIFFHWTGLLPDTTPFLELKEDMEVEFKPIRWNDGRYRAIKIRVLENESSNT